MTSMYYLGLVAAIAMTSTVAVAGCTSHSGSSEGKDESNIIGGKKCPDVVP